MQPAQNSHKNVTLQYFYYIVDSSICWLLLSSDITRACLLDESQGRTFAEILPVILKGIGRQKAKDMFPVSHEDYTVEPFYYRHPWDHMKCPD